MSAAVIRLGPIATLKVLARDDLERRTLYERIDLLPGGAEVWVDHDESQPIGRVLELCRMDAADSPFGLSLFARCEIDSPPAWLKRNTAASISYKTLWRGDVNGWEIIRHGFLNEVSVLSPSLRPAEPLARVMLWEPEREPEPKPERELQEFYRRVGDGEDPERVLADMKRRGNGRRSESQIIRRDVGQILGVR